MNVEIFVEKLIATPIPTLNSLIALCAIAVVGFALYVVLVISRGPKS